jgi:hypothetical protein
MLSGGTLGLLQKLPGFCVNTLNAELNPICHLLALLGARHILHVSRVSVKLGDRHGRVVADLALYWRFPGFKYWIADSTSH